MTSLPTSTTGSATVLTLPLPPSQPGKKFGHPLSLYRAENEYRLRCWASAIQCAKPQRDPAILVTVSAVFFVPRKRDEVDNLPYSLKWVLDTLKQKDNEGAAWRQGVYDLCGYLVDDDPAHCLRGSIVQEVDRANPRIELVVEALT